MLGIIAMIFGLNILYNDVKYYLWRKQIELDVKIQSYSYNTINATLVQDLSVIL